MADIHPSLPPLEQPRNRSVATPEASSNNRPRSNPPTRNDAVREAPPGGQNAEEPIMIGSSDEEDNPPLAGRRTASARSTAEQRARIHNNRRGELSQWILVGSCFGSLGAHDGCLCVLFIHERPYFLRYIPRCYPYSIAMSNAQVN